MKTRPFATALAFAAACVSPAAAQWGGIAGTVTLDPSLEIPAAATLELDAKATDRAYCVQNGAPPNEKAVVNAKNRGVKNVFVYLKEVAPDAIHPSFPQSKADVQKADEADFLKANGVSWDAVVDAVAAGKADAAKLKANASIDQVRCVFVPHAMFMREGQKLLVKNSEPVSHNFNISSFEPKNTSNQTMPPKSVLVRELAAENAVIGAECNVHGWMKMHLMVLSHPYCAITDADGNYKLPNVKAGKHKLVFRHCDGMYLAGKAGIEVVVEEGKDAAAAGVMKKLPAQ